MSVSRKLASNQHVKSIVEKLKGVENIVCYSLCLPTQFAAWLNEGGISADDRLALQHISDQISQSLFRMDASCKLEIISEQEVTDTHRSLFILSVGIRHELERWKVNLQAWQPAGESLVIAKTALMSGAGELQSLLDMRETILNSHCSWRSLSHSKNNQLTEIRKKLDGLKQAQQFVIDMMLPLMKVGTNAAIPLHKHMHLMRRVGDLIGRQLILEDQVYNRTMLERFQHAVINLTHVENGCDKWLFDELTNNSKFRHVISRSISKLVPLQKKLDSYLEWQIGTDNDLARKTVQFGLDCLVMNSVKETTREAYQERTRQELALNQAAFFNANAKIEQQYQESLDNYKREHYPAALQGFLQGALKMHAPSLRQAGEMMLQGLGCSVNAAAASELLLIAYGLEDSRINRISLLTFMHAADALPVTDNVCPDFGIYPMADIEIVKKIYFMKTSVMERLFRLGEALILMMLVRESVSDKNTAAFERACFFFEHAYKYVKGAYERKAVLRMAHADGGAELRDECERLERKMKQCQQDIVEQFSCMDGGVYCSSAPAIIGDFYSRLGFDVVAAVPCLRS